MAKKGSTESKPLIITLVFVILALIGVSIYLYILIGEREQYQSDKKKADEDVAKEKEVTNYHKFVTRLLKSYLVDVDDGDRQKINDDMKLFNSGKLGATDPERDKIKALIAKLDASGQANEADAVRPKGDKYYELVRLVPKDTTSLVRGWGKVPDPDDKTKSIDLTEVNKNFSIEVVKLREALLKQQDAIVTLAGEKATAEKALADEKKANEASKKADKTAFDAAVAKAVEDLTKQTNSVKSINEEFTKAQGQVSEARAKAQEWEKKYNDAVVAKETAEKERDKAIKQREVNREDFVRFEKPRGEISEIQRGGNVIVKLPTTRNLEAGATFSVRGVNQLGQPLEKNKGNLKVTQVGESYCVASIVDQKDSAHDPIMKGDKVFSLSWDPEERKHVVLLGAMNGGGPGIFTPAEANQELLDFKRKLEQQGTIVDAYLDLNTFKMEGGKIGMDTDYLILGRVPESAKPVKTESGELTLNQAVSAAISDGMRYGAQIVPLRRYMTISGAPLSGEPRDGK